MNRRILLTTWTIALLSVGLAGCPEDEPDPNNSTNDMAVVTPDETPDTPDETPDIGPEDDQTPDMPVDPPDETPDMPIDPPDETPDMVDPPEDMDEDMPSEDEDMAPVDPCTIDSDGDTISDCIEEQNGTDPNNADTDYDGLSDADEIQLGTDPTVIDSDGDGLGDYEEFQLGTDPTDVDTDGDGLTDDREGYFGFDPNKPSTYNDGIFDGDRFIVNACNTPASEPVDFYKSSTGDWLLGLPAAFNNYVELAPTAMPAKVVFSVFDDPANEVSAFILSTDRSGAANPVTKLLSYRSSITSVGSIFQDLTEGEFTTHDAFKAAPGEYRISASTAKSSRQVRDELLFAIAPFTAADVMGMPNASGNPYTNFIIKISVIVRDDRFLTLATIAPEQLFETRDAVKFRMSDLTNTTNVAQAGDGTRLRCFPFPATTEVPAADFYWVLDQSGSMNDDFDKVKSFAQDFYNQLLNTALDFRLGVANMEDGFGGKLRTNPGWHTDPNTFRNEIQYYVIDCSSNFGGSTCSGGSENGLYAGREGIKYMRRSNTPQSMRLRPNAQLATIFMSDEEDQSLKDGRDPGGSNVGRNTLLNNYKSFFAANPISFAIVGTGSGCGENGSGYRDVALASGGAAASLCAQDLRSTIQQIIDIVAGRASTFRLPDTPISSTLRVFQAEDDGTTGQWVPRSRINGFDYFPQSNSIAFFGSYRPEAGSTKPVQIAVHYQTFRDKTKTPPSSN